MTPRRGSKYRAVMDDEIFEATYGRCFLQQQPLQPGRIYDHHVASSRNR